MKIGNCKLCKQKKNLIRKSHIIPDFMYDSLFDKNHRIGVYDLNILDRENSIPTGYYNEYFLCEYCDNVVIGQLEDYAKIALYGGEIKQHENIFYESRISQTEVKSVYISGINYKLFKLFLLSIIWRASISKLRFFNKINLEYHEDVIRQMLLNGDPSDEKKYSTCLVYLKTSDLMYKSIIEPNIIKNNRDFILNLFINGIAYHYNLGSFNNHKIFVNGLIKKTNEMEVAILEGLQADNYLSNIVGRKIRIE
jgi:hypothetical protein